MADNGSLTTRWQIVVAVGSIIVSGGLLLDKVKVQAEIETQVRQVLERQLEMDQNGSRRLQAVDQHVSDLAQTTKDNAVRIEKLEDLLRQHISNWPQKQ